MTTSNSRALLFGAIDNNDSGVVKDLIDEGLNVNTKNSVGTTPICHAVTNGKQNIKIIQALINGGADINTVCFGLTPLHYACRQDNPAMVRLLIGGGADVNHTITKGIDQLNNTTPFHSAINVECPNLNVIQALIDAGCDMVTPDINVGSTPLHYTVSNKNSNAKLVEIVLDGIKKYQHRKTTMEDHVNIKNAFGYTPLHYALYNNPYQITTISLLLENGASMNIRDRNYNTGVDIVKEIKNPDIKAAIQMKMQFYEE